MSATATDFLTTQETEALGLPPYSRRVPMRTADLIDEFRKLRQALQRPVKFERRSYGRIPLPLLLRVTPLDQTGQRLDELTIDGGRQRHFAQRDQLLPRTAAAASPGDRRVRAPGRRHFTMEIDLGWCQFTGTGWYVSGGRLLRSLAPAE